MPTHDPASRWLARVQRGGGPLYLSIVNAIEAAVRAGELQPGDQLPPQRRVAELLGIDFTTVTRAYSAARARGLVEGAVGRGTFVRPRADEDEAGLVDLSMNLPPPPDGVSLGALLRETTAAVLQRTDTAALMAYHSATGSLGQRAAGAAWIEPCVEAAPERVIVTAGAQAALAAIFSTVCRPGDAVVVEPLTYPGMKSVAQALGLRLIPCEGDEEGPSPAALERLCAEEGPTALYLLPTMQNPTAASMGEQRRRDIARIASARNLWVVEDDPYSRLAEAPPQALATFAPERTFYVSTLSKCLSPGLRIAFLLPPPGMEEKVAQSLRALYLMPAPLTAAVVTAWIRDGSADDLLAAVRRETRTRRALAAEHLPEAVGHPDGIHVWLGQPAVWDPQRLRAAAQELGVSLVAAESFAVGPAFRNGVRISLGGPAKRSVLAEALANVGRLVREEPSKARLAVTG